MNRQEHKQLYELIQSPPLGSKMEAVKNYGIDLTLLLHNLTLTPVERIKQTEPLASLAEALYIDSPILLSQRVAGRPINESVLRELEALKEMRALMKPSNPTDS